MTYLSPDEMDRRDRAHDLAQVRAARPKGPGECGRCLQLARARFPVFEGCLNRVLVTYACAPCAMLPQDPGAWRWYCYAPSRSECERILAEPARHDAP